MKLRQLMVLVVLIVTTHQQSVAQKLVTSPEYNVIYGMVSGTALLMDVYKPSISNHKAIVYITGSAWGYVYPMEYDQTPLKDDVFLDSAYTGKWVKSLAQAGFTVFVINHRFSPRFKFPDIPEDCRRAVRYVRFHAKEYGIDPLHIGAMGHSSGGNLSSMLGLKDPPVTGAVSAIDSVSSKVQAVVTLAAPFNLADMNRPEDTTTDNNFYMSAVTAYMGELPEVRRGSFVLAGKYAESSPYALVTKDAAPTLIYYSDNDPVIAVRQGKDMYEKLIQNKVPAKIVLSAHTGHNPIPDMTEITKWFEKHLR